MSRNYKILATTIFILLIFIFFSYVLFNKIDEKKSDEEFSKGRVIGNLEVSVIDSENNKIKKDKIYNYLKDNKTNIIHFWASWCSTCVKENVSLKEYIKNKKDINLISVIFKDDISSIDFKNLKNLYNINIDDSNGFVALEFGASGVPESFIVDSNGKILKHIIGNISNGELS